MVARGRRAAGRAGCRPERLLCRAQFLAVQSQGRRQRGQWVSLLAWAPNGGSARVGLTVSRRVGQAVTRNRVRRRLREIVRALGPRWPADTDIVVVAQPAAAGAAYDALATEVARLLGRLSRRAGGNRPGTRGGSHAPASGATGHR